MKIATLSIICVLVVAGCQSAYYGTMERFGIHKRDILVDRVEDARDAQEEGQEQFRSALEQFRSVVEFEGGDLEEEYERLNSEFEDSTAAADAIHERVNEIEMIAEDLFEEWREELDLYTDERLKRDSAERLEETEQRYGQLIAAMREAEERLDPVINTMQDQVLYLKHNLNARAVQSLRGEVSAINRDVDELLEAMEQAIAEADVFIEDMRES